MKKVLSVLLVLIMSLSVFAGCNGGSKEEDTTFDAQSAGEEYKYVYRDLPETKNITPASDFACGSGLQNDPYKIENAEQLALMQKKISEDSKFKSASYILTADISLNDTSDFDNWRNSAPEYSWIPIGLDSGAFTGVLDGDGHTVSGLYINANCGSEGKYSANCYGLFDSVGGSIKNVNIDNSYIEISGNSCSVGSVAGKLTDSGVIENCSSSAVLYSYDNECGGIVGSSQGGIAIGSENSDAKYSSVSNCMFGGTLTQIRDGSFSFLGGIVGSCGGNINNCINSSTIKFTGSNIDSAGGIAGKMNDGSMSACKNTGSLICETEDGKKNAISGGIVGKVFLSSTGSEKYMSRGVNISGCENGGTVSGQLYAGGIAGQVSNDHNDYSVKITNCKNGGAVSSKNHSGGVIGYMNCIGDSRSEKSISVSGCENNAEITGETSGGIVAELISETGDVELKNCNNSGTVFSDGQNCAGIIAYFLMNSKPSDCNVTVDNCNNSGSISSDLNAGGIICFMDMPVCLETGKNISISVLNCDNGGDITVKKVNGFIGGVIGNWGVENMPTTVDKCSNSGKLAITASADSMTASDAEIMTVSRITGGIIGRVGSGLLLTVDSDKADKKNVQKENAVLKITNCSNTGLPDITNINAENYNNLFGGIVGNTCGEDGFSFLAENCTYTGFDRGLGNDDLPDIGTKK